MELLDLKAKYDVQDHIESSVEVPDLTECKGIIYIKGSSGSGKSTILRKMGHSVESLNNEKDVIGNFPTLEIGEELLLAFGLRSIPTWFRSPSTLSNGEHHRAEVAYTIAKGNHMLDEFTSVVDRNTAKALSVSVRKWFDRNNTDKLILASCHEDVVEWLQPDWVYDADSKVLVNRRVERRPEITLTIKSSNYKDWELFKKHHYLSSAMSKATHSYTAYIEGKAVAYCSIIHGCSRDIRSYWRECRLVVLPEFQGLGIGTKLSDTVAQLYKSKGFRFFAKTAHPVLGEHREKDPQLERY